jgi:hypothetical protein
LHKSLKIFFWISVHLDFIRTKDRHPGGSQVPELLEISLWRNWIDHAETGTIAKQGVASHGRWRRNGLAGKERMYLLWI